MSDVLTFNCQTTKGVVEKRFVRLADFASFGFIGLCVLPSELDRMRNLRSLWLNNNALCSLPSEIELLSKLAYLNVRGVKSRSPTR
jgi:Leucine-rich repeat (LRR) protein